MPRITFQDILSICNSLQPSIIFDAVKAALNEMIKYGTLELHFIDIKRFIDDQPTGMSNIHTTKMAKMALIQYVRSPKIVQTYLNLPRTRPSLLQPCPIMGPFLASGGLSGSICL